MRPMRLKSFFLALVLIGLSSGVRAEETSLGVIVPLSGPYAHFGEAGRIGLQLGLGTTSSENVRTIYEDSHYDGAKAVTAFAKLSQSDHVAAVIVLGSPPSSAVIPIAAKQRLPVFAWTPSKKITAGKPYVVRLMSSAPEQGETMAKEVRARGYKDIAFFSAQNEFAQSVRDGFLAHYQNPLSANEEFAPAEQDFRSAISRARAAGVGAIGLCLNTGQIPAFVGQLAQLHLSVPIFGCHAMSSRDVLEALRANNFSAWFVEGLVSEQFQKKFEKAFPDTSGIWLAAAFHDLGRLLTQVPLDHGFIANVVGKSIEESAFVSSRIMKGEDDVYLDVPLGITRMERGVFDRS